MISDTCTFQYIGIIKCKIQLSSFSYQIVSSSVEQKKNYPVVNNVNRILRYNVISIVLLIIFLLLKKIRSLSTYMSLHH